MLMRETVLFLGVSWLGKLIQKVTPIMRMKIAKTKEHDLITVY